MMVSQGSASTQAWAALTRCAAPAPQMPHHKAVHSRASPTPCQATQLQQPEPKARPGTHTGACRQQTDQHILTKWASSSPLAQASLSMANPRAPTGGGPRGCRYIPQPSWEPPIAKGAHTPESPDTAQATCPALEASSREECGWTGGAGNTRIEPLNTQPSAQNTLCPGGGLEAPPS